MVHTVLFVDDEPNVTNGLKHALFEEDFDIQTARSGQEALDILRTCKVDVVISDELMPGMLGSELMAIVSENYPDTVRIILTGHASLDAAVSAINNGGIYRFLLKPCNAIDLAVTIRQALQQQELIAESRKLLKVTQQQSSMLHRLETEHPGISGFNKNSQGAIIIEDPQENIENLIQKINEEVERTKGFLSNRTSDSSEPTEGMDNGQEYFG